METEKYINNAIKY